MRKASVLSIFIWALTVFIMGCGGSAGIGSGTAPGSAPSGDSSGDPISPPAAVNSAPAANAGLDQTVLRQTIAQLDGTGSSDPDGDLLGYRWTISSKPEGSTATLSGADQPSAYLTPDLSGEYVIQLIVVDAKGLAGSPDTVRISTVNSAPIANAGVDLLLTSPGTTVPLSGDASWDPDNDPIAYSWTMKSKPDGSLAVLSDPTSPTPTFVADVYGDYVIELVVRDASAYSGADTVIASFGNLNPVADAGGSDAVRTGTVVNLDGSKSYDPNGDPLTYQWSFVSRPSGSAAELMALGTVNPHFTPDVVGTYVISLVVSDGSLTSDPGSATITAFSHLNPAIRELLDALDSLNGLDPEKDFKSRNMKKTLAKKINSVIQFVEEENYQVALSELKADISKKMDGCAEKGTPEHNDWITSCAAQNAVYPHITSAVAELEAL